MIQTLCEHFIDKGSIRPHVSPHIPANCKLCRGLECPRRGVIADDNDACDILVMWIEVNALRSQVNELSKWKDRNEWRV